MKKRTIPVEGGFIVVARADPLLTGDKRVLADLELRVPEATYGVLLRVGQLRKLVAALKATDRTSDDR